MDVALPPEARLRFLAAARLLERLLLAALLVTLFEGGRRATRPPPPPPLAIDLARDPFERLLLLPGVGPARARALLAARARDGPPGGPADLSRVPGCSPALLAALAASPRVRALLDGLPLSAPAANLDR